ncbi:ankyrin repeat domain-containing protein [Butyrivibrio sp. JL13D10]|uniref:ankyrin repeat domain-containing protein n=1 Tax=Butyrivibrio sp. JL13D10 TaxID=3236815 RepID=UPI0038B5F814
MTICDIFDAAYQGDFDMLKQYYKGDINCVDKYNGLNLLQAVMSKDGKYQERLEIVTFLLDEGIDVNFVDNKDKENALHYLFSTADDDGGLTYAEYALSVTKLLLDAGIDVNHKDRHGSNSVTNVIALNFNNEDAKLKILEMLLDAGAEYREKDNYGFSCLDYAKRFKKEEIVKMLEERMLES